jgi:hypothetical protein
MLKICVKNHGRQSFLIDDRDLNGLIFEIRLQPVLPEQLLLQVLQRPGLR